MDRDRAEELINAAADGQISADDEAELSELLAEDMESQAVAAAVRQQDAQLRRAFARRREAAAALTDRVMNSLSPPIRPRQASFWASWLPLLLAAAAGFLLAIVLFRPWEKSHEVANSGARIDIEPVVARLTVATGTVNLAANERLPAIACPSDGPIACAQRVSTGPQVRCELSTPDGSAVRLDGGTAVKFDRPRTISMERGELWSNVTRASEPFAVKSSQATVTSEEGKFDLACKPGEMVLKVVEGTALLHVQNAERTVPAGHEVTILNGGVVDEQTTRDLVFSTRWINAVLALKGPDNPELEDRFKQMFAQIGESKLKYLYESEIRAMGDASVLPLVHYLVRSTHQTDQIQRVEAARILADLAAPRSIPDLITLLADENGDVRFYIAQALTRLTGQTQGRSPDLWRSDSPISCQATHRDWQAWWAENKNRYVEANRQLPTASQGSNVPK